VVDFTKIREEYLAGERVGDIADRHRVTSNTVAEYVRRNNLGKHRKAIQANVNQKVMAQQSMDVVAELAIINGRDVALSNRLRDLIAGKMNDDLTVMDIGSLARTLKDVQHVGRIALDANSEAIRTELLSKKDLRDYSETELLQLLQENEEE